MVTMQENPSATQGLFANVKFAYEQVDSTSLGDTYKCVLRYQGRQLTTRILLGNRKAFPQKLDVIYSLIEDLKVVYVNRNVQEFMAAYGYSDERQATQIFEAYKKRGQKVTRLFGNDLTWFTRQLSNF